MTVKKITLLVPPQCLYIFPDFIRRDALINASAEKLRDEFYVEAKKLIDTRLHNENWVAISITSEWLTDKSNTVRLAAYLQAADSADALYTYINPKYQ